ncbi:MAG: SDR family NAD(P)-dependent oxidoreductase [Candidatus Odinarchaeota archaeon]
MDFDLFRDKVILVTGAAGSIGSEVVKQLLKYEPRAIRALDTNETGLFYLENALDSECLRIFIGDVRDTERLSMAMRGVDIVFHTAALKHVPICEYNPFEAIRTNNLGTQNVLQMAIHNKVNKVITISSDKAINPTNVMGATKLLAERLTIAANLYSGFPGRHSFSTVRFGNVLGSRGSVIPLMFRQIRRGEPVTITDPEMTRYIMKIDDAVQLVLRAATMSRGGEIFILEMPALRVADLVDSIIEVAVPRYKRDPSEVKTKIIGRRAGEKDYEELMSNYESDNYHLLKKDKIYILIPKEPYYYPDEILEYYKELGAEMEVKDRNKLYSSNKAELLTKEQITLYIKDVVNNNFHSLDFE